MMTKHVIRIMSLGASITAGVPLGGGYRIKLWETAQEKDWNIEFVGSQCNQRHEGHPGFHIEQIAQLVDEKLAKFQPQMILLYIGTNDAEKEDFDIAIVHQQLQGLIEQIFRDLPNVELLVTKLGPAVNSKTDANIQKINAVIPDIVRFEKAQGHQITMVDMSQVLTKQDLVDGIHPTPHGYNKMAEQWARAIQPLFERMYEKHRM